MKRQIIFHIGLEKTGTDSFQRFCTEERALLRQHSTLYPTACLAFGKYNHEPLVASYLAYEDFSIRSSRRARADVLHSLRAEIDEAGADKVLISGEHFSSRFKETEIAQLADDFSEFNCRIAVVVREHGARLLSAYSQSVLSGRGITLDAYCDEVFEPGNRYIRYATTIGAWETVFGRENISLFPHSRRRDIVPLLGTALISPSLVPPPTKLYWDNLSIGPGPTESLRRVNAAIAHLPGSSSSVMRRVLRGFRRGVAQFLVKLHRGHSLLKWQLSARNQAILNKIAAIDNDWMKNRYGITLADEENSCCQSDWIKDPISVK